MKSLLNQLIKRSNGHAFANLTRKNKWVIGSSIILLLIIIIFLIHHQSTTISYLAINENTQTRTILNQLSDKTILIKLRLFYFQKLQKHLSSYYNTKLMS